MCVCMHVCVCVCACVRACVCVCVIKHSYTEIFIAALYKQGYNNAQARASYS